MKCCFWAQVPQAFAIGASARATVGGGGALAGVSGPQAGAGLTFSVSGIWLVTAVKGLVAGLEPKASNIGVAAATFWFSGSAPRICSIVRTIEICE